MFVPLVAESVSIPVIAAGGIGSGKAMAAAFALGAEGVQIGSRFVVTPESSAHINFKNAIVDANEGATELTLKELTPVRLMKNKFYNQIQDAYSNNATDNELKEILGRARAKMGCLKEILMKVNLKLVKFHQLYLILNQQI